MNIKYQMFKSQIEQIPQRANKVKRPLNDKHFNEVAQADDKVCLYYTKWGIFGFKTQGILSEDTC